MAEARKCDCCGEYFDFLPTLKSLKTDNAYKNCIIRLELDYNRSCFKKDLCPIYMDKHILKPLFKNEVELYVEVPESKDL